MLQSHRQVGLAASLWLCLVALTALLLNHRDMLLPAATERTSPYESYLLCHAVSPHDPAHVMIGTSGGLFYSEDGGKSFRAVALPGSGEQVVGVAFHPAQPQRFYAAMRQGGLYASMDGGKLWERVDFPGPTTIQSIGVAFDGSLTVLAPEGLYTRVEESWRLTPRAERSPAETSRRDVLRQTYNLHDGKFWGRAATFVSDCVALALLWLCITGWVLHWKKK